MELSELFQNFRIKEVQEKSNKANFKAHDNSINIRELQDKVDYLSVVCLAMCELLEEVGLNKEMMLKKIQEIDLRDGKLDGKTKWHNNQCEKCSRVVAGRHTKCIYCGHYVTKTSVL